MTTVDLPYRRKLIEVSMPLNAISSEATRDKFLRHGHPSTLHTWWARRPLPACRAVIFASLVDDPEDWPSEFPTEEAQRIERKRLHSLLSKISKWENVDERTPDGERLIQEARFEVARSLARGRGEPPPKEPTEVLKYLTDEDTGLTVYDPFSGGGSIPLEAQRLGLNAVGSDLNPISVLITKSMIELPLPFKEITPVNNEAYGRLDGSKSSTDDTWQGYAGLANDIRYYGRRVREEAFKRIGHLYPRVTLDDNTEATVVAWLWAHTVPCSNPACEVAMPLIRNFQVSKHKARPRWMRPVVNERRDSISFEIVNTKPLDNVDSTVNRKGARCLACESTAPLEYVRTQASAGNMGQQLIAIVAEGNKRREFLSPVTDHELMATTVIPPRRPPGSLPLKAISIRTRRYGITEWHQLFTERQLNALCNFSDVLTHVAREIVDDGGSEDYAKVVRTYLAFAIGRLAHAGSRLSMWVNSGENIAGAFARQAIGMVWDFAESNPFSNLNRNWSSHVEWIAKVVERLPSLSAPGVAFQADAANSDYLANGPVIVTDPPYYDNIGYADISDFFYIWHKDALEDAYPELFYGRQTPKGDEIVAGPMFENPRERFELLISKVLDRVRETCSDMFPSSIFYAYMQKETTRNGISSTGWETFLSAVNKSGFRIVGTWPIRTEGGARLNALTGSTLASSVVVVTRPRDMNAPTATRQQFVSELEATLPNELGRLIREENIAPVDLAQAAIGPGMEIYTKYSSVQTIAGDPVPVREALTEINRVIGDYFLSEQGELDELTRFCIDWLREHGFDAGPFGSAEDLAKAKNVTIGRLEEQGILEERIGSVRLLPTEAFITSQNELKNLSPSTTAWEGLMRVAYHFQQGEDRRGVNGAADVIREIGPKAGEVERLARIMFNHYDRKFQPSESRIYNDIADAWRDIREQARFERQMSNQ